MTPCPTAMLELLTGSLPLRLRQRKFTVAYPAAVNQVAGSVVVATITGQ